MDSDDRELLRRASRDPEAFGSSTAATPAPRSDRFDRQLQLLGILRNRTTADDDPQEHAAVRAYTRAGMPVRTGYARLLGKAPSEYAFVLLPVLEFDRNALGSGSKMKTIRDGICLM